MVLFISKVVKNIFKCDRTRLKLAPCATLRMGGAFERLSSNPRLHQDAARSQKSNNMSFVPVGIQLDLFFLVHFMFQLDLKLLPYFSITKNNSCPFQEYLGKICHWIRIRVLFFGLKYYLKTNTNIIWFENIIQK